jgi:glycosyltransferase involved in cell wall biosynthesis
MISVIIPCFNEEKTIDAVLSELFEVIGNKEQIIVVDNGSTDNTFHRASLRGVEVYKEPNRGKGFAFRKGLTYIEKKSKIIVLIDGDATYSLSNLKRDIDFVLRDGYDMIVGNRIVENPQDMPYREGHRFGNRLFSILFRKMFSTDIIDVLSGYRILSRGFALSFMEGASKFELETELNAHAFHLNTVVKNSEVTYRARPTGSHSKLRTYYDGFKILGRNLSLWFTERPFRAFLSLALPLYFLSTVFFVRAALPFIETGLVPNLPSLVASFGVLLLAAVLSIAGIVLDRTNVLRRALSRYIYMQAVNVD